MRFRRAIVPVVAFPLAACAVHLPQPTRAPAPAPLVADTRVLADSSVTPDTVAAVVRRECRGTYEQRRACVERSLDRVLARFGVARAMAVLDHLAADDEDLRREAHGLAHGLGIAAYRTPQTVAEIFAACPATQISGCRHGVIQGYFLDVARRTGEVGGHDLDALCAPHRRDGDLYAQCAHGIGHGLMAITGHRLPGALTKCDLLSDASARANCWGGAFMENIVAVTHPEHTAESHAAVSSGGETHHGGMDHGGMDHGAMNHGGMDHGAMAHDPGEPAWKPLDPADPLYPCDAVGEKYWTACYLIQTAAILTGNHGDFAATAAACATAPAAMVRTCYTSLGRDITSYAARDPARTAEFCARAGAAAELDCLRGAVVALFAVDLKPADAIGLCRAVAGDERKDACYRAAARRMGVSIAERERLAAACALSETEYEDVCRTTAGLRPKASAR